jgi:hypothetical protein
MYQFKGHCFPTVGQRGEEMKVTLYGFKDLALHEWLEARSFSLCVRYQ